MKFEDFGKDYYTQINKLPDSCHEVLENQNRYFTVAANPVVTKPNEDVRLAFFGLNAYCKCKDYPEAKRERNFTEWCQSRYNAKIFRVMEQWYEGLPQKYINGGSIYFSNFVKLVLKECFFQKAQDVEHRLYQCPECIEQFQRLALDEIHNLKAADCRIFICFGWAAFKLMKPLAQKADVQLIREYHFSRNEIKHTTCLINEYAGKI